MKFKLHNAIQMNDPVSVKKILSKINRKYKNNKDEDSITPMMLSFYNLLYYNNDESKEIFKIIVSDYDVNINSEIFVMDKYKKVKHEGSKTHILIYMLLLAYKEFRYDILPYIEIIINRKDLDHDIFYAIYLSPVNILIAMLKDNIEIEMSNKLLKQIFELNNYVLEIKIYKWIKNKYSEDYLNQLMYAKIINNKLSEDVINIEKEYVIHVRSSIIYTYIVLLSDDYYVLKHT